MEIFVHLNRKIFSDRTNFNHDLVSLARATFRAVIVTGGVVLRFQIPSVVIMAYVNLCS